MQKYSRQCQIPPLEEPFKDATKNSLYHEKTQQNMIDTSNPKMKAFPNPLTIKPITKILCYRAGCCPSCPPCGILPCKTLGVECGGRHDVEITVNPRIDMKEIDACIRPSCCSGNGSCGCSRCLASPPHNKRPCDAGVPCLPIAPRLPVPFGLRCSGACPSPPCVPSPCPPVSGGPCCPSRCPPC